MFPGRLKKIVIISMPNIYYRNKFRTVLTKAHKNPFLKHLNKYNVFKIYYL